MAKKAVLFLSVSSPRSVEAEYACPKGPAVRGTQTNDAPVRYLLRENPAMREIICVVTRQAKESAWERFCSVVKEAAPAVSVIPVSYEEDQDFSETAVPQILQHVSRGDEICLDITGGFRNASIHMLLLTRILQYRGITLTEAVYSRKNPPEVQDIRHMLGLFDLISGMQELTSLGSAGTLRKYYGSEPEDPAIGALLTAMERLTEAITLCRTAQIQSRMEDLSNALIQAEDCADPLMRTLLPVFREKFGIRIKNGTMKAGLTTPGLIRWCVKNGMLQQALTVYTERIPAYLREKGILTAGPKVQPVSVQAYEDPDAAQLVKDFLHLSDRFLSSFPSAEVSDLRNYFAAHASDVISHLQNGTPLTPPAGIARGVENAVLVAETAYPNQGSLDPNWVLRLPEDRQGLSALRERVRTVGAGSAAGLLRSVAKFPSGDLDVLLERNGSRPPARSSRNSYVLTIRNLDSLLPQSGYSSGCSTDRLAQICTDYIYIKMLRNLTNHAGEEVTAEWDPMLDFLRERGDYIMPDELTMDGLKDMLDMCLSHLQQSKKTGPKRPGRK